MPRPIQPRKSQFPSSEVKLGLISKAFGRVYKTLHQFSTYLLSLSNRIGKMISKLLTSEKKGSDSYKILSFKKETDLILNSRIDNLSKVVQPTKTQKIQYRVRDVPDDGNCLFYSIAVGLRKKFYNNAEIQEKLNWKTVPPKDLEGNLKDKNKKELLKAPAQRLREQCVEYMLEHQKNDDLSILLVASCYDHVEAMKKQLTNEELSTQPLIEDINYLFAHFNKDDKDILFQIAERRGLIADNLDAVERIKKTIQENFNEENQLSSYIRTLKEEGTYTGYASILALSKLYDIPIKLYREGQQDPEFFNRKPNIPPLTIKAYKGADGNLNHFKFLED